MQRQIQFETKVLGQRKLEVVASPASQALNPDHSRRPVVKPARLTREAYRRGARAWLCAQSLLDHGTDSSCGRVPWSIDAGSCARTFTLISGARLGRFDAHGPSLRTGPGPLLPLCLVARIYHTQVEERCA